MPTHGTRSKDVSPVPSSEPRAPTHKSSHTSRHCSHTRTSKKSDSKSRPSAPGTKGASKAASASHKDGEAPKSAQSASKGSQREHDIEAPPSRDVNTASESVKERGPVDWSLVPYALLGFIAGLLIGAVIVLFVGVFCCIFADWRRIWDDKPKRAFLGGFVTGVLIAIIVYLALFIALAVG